MEGSVKRIIDGMTYNTETATRVAVGGPPGEWSFASWELYRSRHGSFFKVVTDHDGNSQMLTPLTDAEAQVLLQKLEPSLVDSVFGPFPEAGAAERRLTIRVPANLAERMQAAAHAKGQSLNSYAMRCFEKCVIDDGQTAWKTQL
jgi:hypothetical protein